MTEVRFSFSGMSAATASKLAPLLQSKLTEVGGLEPSVLREREEAQDAGTVVSVLLGAPAVAAAVRAVGVWLKRNNQSAVDIKLPTGEVVFRNMRSEDVPDAIRALEKILLSDRT